MELDYKAIGKRIKIARIKADLKQEQLLVFEETNVFPGTLTFQNLLINAELSSLHLPLPLAVQFQCLHDGILDFLRGRPRLEKFTDGRIQLIRVLHPQAHRKARLGVYVQKQHLFPLLRQSHAEIDRSGGLADAALLIGNGYDFSFVHGVLPPFSGYNHSRLRRNRRLCMGRKKALVIAPAPSSKSFI